MLDIYFPDFTFIGIRFMKNFIDFYKTKGYQSCHIQNFCFTWPIYRQL